MPPRAVTRALLAAAAVLPLAACGYGFSQRYVAKGGIERLHVRPFENLSTEPELGATVTSALRTELSRRGAEAGEGAAAAIEGDVRAMEPAPASTRGPAVATWTIVLEVRAHLVQGDARIAEHVARRQGVFLAGEDPLETEGRRALALRQLADQAARDVLRAFER